jgi:trans-aconitate 2-methyltransferase
VVVSNAALHWVPDHLDLLPRWVAALPPDAWLAVQVPGNFDAPSHLAMRAVAAEPAWRDRMPDAIGPREVPAAAGYAALLTRAGCAVDAWETTYVHLLPAAPADPPDGHPVLRWMEGTALRPIRAALGDGPDWAAFRAALGERLADAYPVDDGLVYFPFRRIFAVARTRPTQTSIEESRVA